MRSGRTQDLHAGLSSSALCWPLTAIWKYEDAQISALASSGQHRLRGLGGDEQIVDICFPFAAFLWKDKEVTSFKPGRGLYHVHQIALGKHSAYDGVLGAVFRAH